MKALIILGGSLYKDNHGHWRTTTFSEGDDFGTLGDRLRVIAGSYVHRDEPNQKIVVFGGKGQLKGVPDVPVIADVMKQELEERGVAKDLIITETESGSTFQQLQQLKRMILEKSIEGAQVISNEYHLPRIEAIIESDAELTVMLKMGNLALVSAESIVIAHNARWKADIEKAYESDAMKDRIAKEQEGVRQIKDGTYKLQ